MINSKFVVPLSSMRVSQCLFCRHAQANNTCEAFPKGIPQQILDNRILHNRPYPGDHNIQFEPEKGVENMSFEPL